MNVSNIAAAVVSAGLSALTAGLGVGSADLAIPASRSAASVTPAATHGSDWSAIASPPRPTDISWSWDWDDENEPWGEVSSDCPTGCSITWEDF
jgi:hypothetical protein